MSNFKFFSRKPKVVGSGKVYRRRRAVRWFRMMTISLTTTLTVSALGLLAVMVAVNHADEVGYAGVVGRMAKGMSLTCGEDEVYAPRRLGIFHPTLPCGTLVRLGTDDGTTVDVPVIHTQVPFRKGGARVVDMTPATAEALGLKGDALHRVALRPLTEGGKGVKLLFPMVSLLQPAPKALADVPFTTDERMHLVKNVLSEAEEYGPLAYVPVVQTTLNRLAVSYRGQTTLKGVIYDPWQFSWTAPKYRVAHSPKGSAAWAMAERVVNAALTDRLSGDYLAVQYMTQKCVIYYDAKYIKAPEWGRFKRDTLQNKEFVLIEMPNTLEVLTGARCLAPAPTTTYAKRMVAMR